MAFTVSTEKTTFGNMKVHIMDVTADGATAELATGLDYIYGMSSAHLSMATGNTSMDYNVLTAATASNGTIAVTGAASGDHFCLVVFGR